MSEKPIIFSGPSIRAILRDENPKTQTRRVLTPSALRIWTGGLDHGGRYVRPDAELFAAAMNNPRDWRVFDGLVGWITDPAPHQSGAVMAQWTGRLPYAVGDRLWVRETWRESWYNDDKPPRDLDAPRPPYKYPIFIRYEATPDLAIQNHPWGRLRSPRHMPKWAARIWLEVTGVRVERVQDISEADAKAEGVPMSWVNSPSDGTLPPGTFRSGTWRQGFRTFWDSLNAKRGHGWDVNDLVYVTEFRQVEEAGR